jgi:tetratricopeptide (TPR) repeat protein
VRLRTARTSLHELALRGRTVEAAFALSYQQLRPAAQTLFRLLGLHPGPDIATGAAAALAGRDLPDADELLTELLDAHLVEERIAGRYVLHNLLREYAGELTAADLPADRSAATRRILEYYLHTSAAATFFLEPDNPVPFNYELGPVPSQIRAPNDRAAAESWFDAERSNLIAAIELAADERHDGQAWRLTRAIWRDLCYHGYDDLCLHTHRIAIEAAERAGEPSGVALGHNDVAAMHYRRGRWADALHHLDRAIAIRAELGDQLRQAKSLSNKATVLHSSGRHREALRAHQEALALTLALPGCSEKALLSSYPNLGQSYVFAGQFAAAEEMYRLYLELVDRIGSDEQRNRGYAQLGELRLRQGRFAEALELLSRACRGSVPHVNDPYHFAEMMRLLGTAHRSVGQFDEALRCHRRSLLMVEESGALFSECDARIELAVTLHAVHDDHAALEQYEQALEMARQLNLERQLAQATDGLAALRRGQVADADRAAPAAASPS